MDLSDNDDSSIEFPSQYKLATIGTSIGLIAALFITVFQLFWDPEVFLMDQPQALDSYLNFVETHATQLLTYYVLDSVFILGYLSLFVGIWLIIRDFGEAFTRIPLALTAVIVGGDIIENAIHFVFIYSQQAGLTPDVKLLYLAWTLNIIIDLASYLAAILFAYILLAIWRPPKLKFVMGIMLTIYALVGVYCLINPPFLLVRNVVFVIGLGFGAYMLSKEENIPLEELEKILYRQKDTQDYIR